MAAVPRPQTRGLLPTSCEVWASSLGNIEPSSLLVNLVYSMGADTSGGLLSTASLWNSVLAVAANMGSVTKLAAAPELTVTQSRDIGRIYGLGQYAFEPQFLVPGGVTYQISLKRVELHSSYALAAFGFANGSIYNQQVPLILKEVRLKDPSQNSTTGETIEIAYFNCWIKQHSYTVDSSSGKVILSNLDLVCGNAISSDSLLISVTKNSGFSLNNPINVGK